MAHVCHARITIPRYGRKAVVLEDFLEKQCVNIKEDLSWAPHLVVKHVFPWVASRVSICILRRVLINALQYVYTRFKLELCGSSGPTGHRLAALLGLGPRAGFL